MAWNQMLEGVTNPSANTNLQKSTKPTIRSIDSGQVIIRLYPIGRIMIPSLGIMLSHGDRCGNNLGTT